MKSRPDETRRLTTDLTADEVALLRDQISNLLAQRRAAEAQLKELSSAMKRQIEQLTAAMHTANDESEAGAGIRDVICRWRTETDDRGVRLWVCRRQDTGARVDVAPLTAADSQEEMFS
jgi:hypothetical protein